MTSYYEFAAQLEAGGASVRRIVNPPVVNPRGVVWERFDYSPFGPDRAFVFTPIHDGGLGSSIFDLTLTQAEAML
jgi:hypothetical protein